MIAFIVDYFNDDLFELFYRKYLRKNQLYFIYDVPDNFIARLPLSELKLNSQHNAK